MMMLDRRGGDRLSEPREASAAIRRELTRLIDEGILRPGARLDPERTLAARFGVSRAAVRAAILGLVQEGKVVRHVGRGSFVVDPSAPRLGATLHSDLSPAEIMEFRLALEPALADLILINANNSEIDAIVDCARQGEDASTRAEWNRLDDRFHTLLAAATHNRIVISLYASFSAARFGTAWKRLKARSTNQTTWPTFQAEHRAIAQALADGDRQLARTAIYNHVMRARAMMMGFDLHNGGEKEEE